MKTVQQEAEALVHNVVAWVEVNRELRSSWVRENLSSMVIQSCKIFKEKFNIYQWKSLFKASNLVPTFNFNL